MVPLGDEEGLQDEPTGVADHVSDTPLTSYIKATFAAGCFWGVEETFRTTPGVINTTAGYTGGATVDPTYKQVCAGHTGHAEAVQVEFDPQRTSFEQLLEVFWDCHNPTEVNRQGPDVGAQYRSAIFTHDEEQQRLAERSKAKAQKRFGRPIATQILPAGPFYPAEEYHQKYAMKRGISSCER
jgi:peptide-methionine (S)-S-oxide reductase